MTRAFEIGFGLGLLLASAFNARGEVALQRGLVCGIVFGVVGLFIGALNLPTNGAEESIEATLGEPERR